MAHFHLTLLLALVLSAVCAEGAPLVYKISAGWDRPKRLDLAEFQYAIQSRDYSSLDLKNSGRLNWIAVDQIYTSRDLHKQIFIKFGLELTDKTQEGVLIKGSSGILYHDRTRDGAPYAIFLQNINEVEARSLVESLPARKAKAVSLKQWLAPLPSAYAEKMARTDDKSTSSASGALVSAEALTTCTGMAWDGAKGAAIETWETAKQLVTDPWAYWESVKGKFAEFKELLANFNAEMAQLIESLSKIDRETALTVACTMAGQAAFAALLMAGAVGAVKGAANLTKMLLQLRAARNALEAIARLRAGGMADSQAVRQMVAGALSCAKS